MTVEAIAVSARDPRLPATAKSNARWYRPRSQCLGFESPPLPQDRPTGKSREVVGTTQVGALTTDGPGRAPWVSNGPKHASSSQVFPAEADLSSMGYRSVTTRIRDAMPVPDLDDVLASETKSTGHADGVSVRQADREAAEEVDAVLEIEDGDTTLFEAAWWPSTPVSSSGPNHSSWRRRTGHGLGPATVPPSPSARRHWRPDRAGNMDARTIGCGWPDASTCG